MPDAAPEHGSDGDINLTDEAEATDDKRKGWSATIFCMGVLQVQNSTRLPKRIDRMQSLQVCHRQSSHRFHAAADVRTTQRACGCQAALPQCGSAEAAAC